MRKIEVNGKKYQMPEGWKDIKLKHLVKIQEFLKGEHNTSVNDVIMTLSVFTNIPAKDIEKWSLMTLMSEYGNVIDKMKQNTFNADISVMKLNGKEYRLRELEDFTTKEFIDYDTLAQDSTHNISTLVALAYLPQDTPQEKYTEAIKQLAKKVEDNLDAEFALAVLQDFSGRLLRYVCNMVDSSEQAKTAMEKNPDLKEKMTVIRNLVGGVGN